MRFATTLLVLLASASRASAYSEAETLPRTLAATSTSGAYRATLVPGRVGEAQATLELKRRGRVLWRAGVLWGGQGAIVVADDGHLATIDDRPALLGQHAIVIYDPRGVLVADHGLRDVLSPEELGRVPKARIGPWRYGGDEPAILGGHLFITAQWGASIGIRLEDGKVTRDFRRFGRLTDYLSGALPSAEQMISVRRQSSPDAIEHDHCALSAAGCRCRRESPLPGSRKKVWKRPLAPARWKALIGQATVLVPLIDTSPIPITDPTTVQIELWVRRKHVARCDAYRVTVDPRVAQGDVARLLEGLLEVTGL